MKKCIRSTYKIEEFEEKWKELMKEYALDNDDWLNNLYDIRSSWVPVYNRSIFFAGMNTTGRSEGINSFFDGFITPTTNLREFVVKYDQALKRIMDRESDEDFESEHKYRIVNEGEFILKHAANLYTRNVFNKFKDEWSKVNLYKVEEMPCDNEYHAYLVKTKLGEHEEFVVKLNLQTYKASSNEAYTTFMEAIKELSKKLSENSTHHATIPSSTTGDPCSTNIDSSQLLLLDPNISQTKGRKKDNISGSKRIKSGIELAQNKKKRKCALCKKIAQHDKRNCPSNLKRRKNESTNPCNEELEDLCQDMESDDQEYC
ncbi:unnamed protein product [Prunus armeniaca]|uniref:Protein FAR1-RELATED SEQUENCE n=1 Tax=Prunus armeniaca TaxID=36596 RepID=A0A6J5U7U0_PRUAR|nr:unnamed protein product [Prunus armeniaca]